MFCLLLEMIKDKGNSSQVFLNLSVTCSQIFRLPTKTFNDWIF